MATISELTVQVLTARLAKRDMSIEELENEFKVISKHLKAIEEGTSLEPNPEPAAETPIKVNMKKTFKANEVVCLICNKGFKTLKRHLAKAHNLTDKEYKQQFNIPAKQSLVASNYSAERKEAAQKNGLGAKMMAGKKAKADKEN